MADTKQIITCPACDKEMTKVFIKDSNINIDICDCCGGILFDNRELEKFDEENENADEILEALKGKSFEPTDEREVRICPICDTPMVKQGTGVEGIEIDVCNVCGSKFLDNGELEEIRAKNGDTDFAKLDSQIRDFAKENAYTPGGRIGKLWTNIYPNLGLRDASEKFVRNFFLK